MFTFQDCWEIRNKKKCLDLSYIVLCKWNEMVLALQVRSKEVGPVSRVVWSFPPVILRANKEISLKTTKQKTKQLFNHKGV